MFRVYNSGTGEPARERKEVRMATLAIVGGQYGSEGKGVITAHLAHEAQCAIRTGGPNAGHSIRDPRDATIVWKMRSVPCAWVNPSCALIIGPGAVVSPEVLVDEVNALEQAGYEIRKRLFVDHRATVIIPTDLDLEADGLAFRIGSTAEGVGQARIRRIQRDPVYWRSVTEALEGTGIKIADTIPMAASAQIVGNVLLEGTQGYGLSLTFGSWPYVTSTDATTAQLMAHAGLSPSIPPIGCLIVYRSFPIRVGGQSGPLSGELTWADISERVGYEVVERTTVTNKIRRIGTWDWDLTREASVVNGATTQALTFADYLDPAVTGETDWNKLTPKVRAWMDQMEEEHGIPVGLVGTGGPFWAVCERPAPDMRRGDSGFRQDNPIILPS